MVRFLKTFLLFIVLYHILVTIICYGIFGGQYQEIFSLVRDGIWIVFILSIAISQRKILKQYIITRKYPLMFLGAVLLFGIVMSQWIGKSRYDILVGIKYGLRYLIIFISATYVGYVLAYKQKKEQFISFLRYILYTLIIIVVVGFLWQIAKLMLPDLFTKIGYGPLRDFIFGDKPPIYYLTGYEGTLRRQGIFAGPNNYGYFLVAFLPVIMYFFREKFNSITSFFKVNKQAIINTAIITLWITAIVMTLSRTAFIGGIVGLALVNIQRIRKNKKIARSIGITIVVGLIGLSILKSESTLGHIAAKFGSLQYVIQQPGGYGLGTSGPAVLHNGTILPENYYIQLMIDIGTIGFILRAILILQITRLAKKTQKNIKEKNTIYLFWQGLNIGFFALLIMGIFLHVFEDSMVNYIFFVLWGILTGYLSTYTKRT